LFCIFISDALVRNRDLKTPLTIWMIMKLKFR